MAYDFLNPKEKKKFHKEYLKKASKTDYVTNVILITTQCCKVCDELNGLIFPLEEELKNMHLPAKGCLKPTGCSCTYGLKILRGENGLALHKPRK